MECIIKNEFLNFTDFSANNNVIYWILIYQKLQIAHFFLLLNVNLQNTNLVIQNI